MSKYDESKKGARFTMCQAALQGGADISIVPKIMEYIETGKDDALKYVSPCEGVEKQIAESQDRYDNLRKRLSLIEKEYQELTAKHKEAYESYQRLYKEAQELQDKIKEEKENLLDFEEPKLGMTINSLGKRLDALNVNKQKLVYVQVGEFVVLVNDVKEVCGKVVLNVGDGIRKNEVGFWRILPEGTMSCGGKIKEDLSKLHDDLGRNTKSIYDVDEELWDEHNVLGRSRDIRSQARYAYRYYANGKIKD